MTADSGYHPGRFVILNRTLQPRGGIKLRGAQTLGELALLTETVRPATAIAREPSAVIRLTRKIFLRMLESYPEAAVKLREQLVARSTQATKEIGNVRARLDTSEAPN